jgi:SAM-dependent methyltransferase
MSEIKRVCPICGGEVFKTFRGREFERCTGCHSMGRTRLMAMAMRFVDIRSNDFPVYHFAPEQALQKVLLGKYGVRYIPADFAPEPYNAWSEVPLRKIDLSRPNNFLPKGGVEGLIHSHVLEHIPGSIERVISQMNDAIAPGGFHLFAVPIYVGWYREDMNPNLSDEDKTERFFQYDHIRAFGTNDFEDRCLRLFEKDFTRIDLNISQQDLIKASVGQTALKNFTGNTPFLFIKN